MGRVGCRQAQLFHSSERAALFHLLSVPQLKEDVAGAPTAPAAQLLGWSLLPLAALAAAVAWAAAAAALALQTGGPAAIVTATIAAAAVAAVLRR